MSFHFLVACAALSFLSLYHIFNNVDLNIFVGGKNGMHFSSSWELVSYFGRRGKVLPILVATGLFKSYHRKNFLSVFPLAIPSRRSSPASLGDPSRRVILVGDIHGQYDHLQCVASFFTS